MKQVLKILKYAGLTNLAVLSAAAILLTIDKKFAERSEHKRSDITSAEGIQSLEKWRIGGIDQWVSIRGQNRANPVIVFLHGGPGSAQIGLSRGVDLTLEKYFTVVTWDQRAAGLSFSPFIPSASITKEQYLSDTLEIIKKSKERLGQQKVFLVGHSWGSYLGAVTAHRHPEHLHAYVGIGQMVNALENETVSLDFTIEQARALNNQEALAELLALGRPPYQSLESMGTQRKWLGEFGGGMFHGAHRQDAFSYMGTLMWASPEYSVVDQLKFFAGMVFTLTTIWPEFFTLDLYKEAPEISVPVQFMHGRHDYNTPFAIMQKYERILKAPRKKIVFFEQSAHAPNFEEPEAFAEAMLALRREILGQ